MGTSSILAGAVMAAVLRASGKSCDKKELIHAVCMRKFALISYLRIYKRLGFLESIHIDFFFNASFHGLTLWKNEDKHQFQADILGKAQLISGARHIDYTVKQEYLAQPTIKTFWRKLVLAQLFYSVPGH
jgi:hypothetical protein